MAQEIAKEALNRCKDVLKSLGENYIVSVIDNGFKPLIIETLMTLADDAKQQLSKEEKEDKLGDSKGAEINDIFGLELASCSAIHTAWSYSFTAYTLYAIRVGHKDGSFFTLCKKYQVSYNTLKAMHGVLAKEQKDQKLPDLPPDCLHGTKCFCCTQNGNINATQAAMSAYISTIIKSFPESKALPDYFSLGDKYEIQQLSRKIFMEAFDATKKQVIKGDYFTDIEPFDEGESINQLLRNMARNEIIKKARATVPNIPIGCIRNNMIATVDQIILAQIDAAVGATWPVAQQGVKVAQEKVTEVVKQGAEKLVEQLKPLLKKILDLVNSKMNKKEEKSEKEEDKKESKKKTQIGDFVQNWLFERSEIGSKFYKELSNENAKAALDDLAVHLEGAINSAFESRLADGAKRLLGDKSNNEIVQIVVEEIANQATKLVRRFTTIQPLMNASKAFFDVRAEFEKKLKEAKGAEALGKAIDEGSAMFWKTLPRIGIALYREMESVKSHIKSDLPSLSAEALEPLNTAADQLYAEQVKAINSVRAQLVVALKGNLNTIANSEQALVDELRKVFRTLVFKNTQILVSDAWTSVAEAIQASSVQFAKEKFEEKVWPEIKPALEALDNLIPEPMKNVGLKIEPLALKVSHVLIEKITRWAITKLVIKLEEILFNQAEKL